MRVEEGVADGKNSLPIHVPYLGLIQCDWSFNPSVAIQLSIRYGKKWLTGVVMSHYWTRQQILVVVSKIFEFTAINVVPISANLCRFYDKYGHAKVSKFEYEPAGKPFYHRNRTIVTRIKLPDTKRF